MDSLDAMEGNQHEGDPFELWDNPVLTPAHTSICFSGDIELEWEETTM